MDGSKSGDNRIMEWITLVKNNIPCDILEKKYEFQRQTAAGDWVSTTLELYLILSNVINNKWNYRYQEIK